MTGETFLTDNDTVFWNTVYGPAPLSEQNIEGLLDGWMTMDGPVARKLWLDLYDAACRTSWFIKRPVIWRCSSRSQPCGVGPSDLTGHQLNTSTERGAL